METMDLSDPKTDLQERLQAQRLSAPSYRVAESGGPAHERWFAVEVSVAGVLLGKGTGRSKRTAERAAAAQALMVDWSALRAGSGAPSRETNAPSDVDVTSAAEPSEEAP
jgi:dsRNA-specific ribonuclease